MHVGCNTLMEIGDGYGDLDKGRMEDDGDGGTPMLSATGTLDRKTGQATPMRQSATGTLDRKTDQAPPTTCIQPSTLTNETRSIINDKECRGLPLTFSPQVHTPLHQTTTLLLDFPPAHPCLNLTLILKIPPLMILHTLTTRQMTILHSLITLLTTLHHTLIFNSVVLFWW
jgi:hypothetical protein